MKKMERVLILASEKKTKKQNFCMANTYLEFVLKMNPSRWKKASQYIFWEKIL